MLLLLTSADLGRLVWGCDQSPQALDGHLGCVGRRRDSPSAQHGAACFLLKVQSMSQGSFSKLLGQASAVRDAPIYLQIDSEQGTMRF